MDSNRLTRRPAGTLLLGAVALLAGLGGFLLGRSNSEPESLASFPPPRSADLPRVSESPPRTTIKSGENEAIDPPPAAQAHESAPSERTEIERLTAALEAAKAESEFWKRDAGRRESSAEERYPAFLEYVAAPDSPDLRSAYELISDRLEIPWKEMSPEEIAALAGDIGPFYREYVSASDAWLAFAQDSRRPPDDPENLALHERAVAAFREVEERLIARFGEHSPYLKRIVERE